MTRLQTFAQVLFGRRWTARDAGRCLNAEARGAYRARRDAKLAEMRADNAAGRVSDLGWKTSTRP
jgi:hypothetical protein